MDPAFVNLQDALSSYRTTFNREHGVTSIPGMSYVILFFDIHPIYTNIISEGHPT